MDYLLKKEIDKLKGEEETTDATITASQYLLQKKLKGSLGEEIKNVLNNPPVIEKKQSKWQTFKKRLRALLTNE